jgi:hypothetical protein
MSGERGEMTLVGLLVAATLFIGVLGATLELFATSERLNRDVQLRVEAQDRVRVATDGLARELRNLASPTPEQPQAVDRAGARDLVFKVVDSVGPNAGANTTNVKRVRYCLDGSGALHRQEQRWTAATVPAVPGGLTGFTNDPSCSPAGWTSSRIVAQHVVNYAGGQSRPVFTYNAATDLTAITSVRAELLVDLDSAHRPGEIKLTTAVFLRNQNRKPAADFTATSSAQGVVLNGSPSTDPEDQPLTFCWYAVGEPTVAAPPSPCASGPYVGTGITFTYLVPWGSTHQIWLEVHDPARLLDKTTTRTITNS